MGSSLEHCYQPNHKGNLVRLHYRCFSRFNLHGRCLLEDRKHDWHCSQRNYKRNLGIPQLKKMLLSTHAYTQKYKFKGRFWLSKHSPLPPNNYSFYIPFSFSRFLGSRHLSSLSQSGHHSIFNVSLASSSRSRGIEVKVLQNTYIEALIHRCMRTISQVYCFLPTHKPCIFHPI